MFLLFPDCQEIESASAMLKLHRLLAPCCAGLIVLGLIGLAGRLATADDLKPTDSQVHTYRVTGLFSPDRQDDLRALLANWPEVMLDKLDYERAEARFRFVPATALPGAKPDKYLEQFQNKLRMLSNGTFGVRPVCTLPREKLRFIEITVAGLDCKACTLAAYEAVAKLDGVEQANASFRTGLVTAWIDPEKTDRAKLEAALQQKGVTLQSP